MLVDCGLFQGQKEWRERNWQDLPVPAKTIDAVILTHAHLDHSGWIPRLVKQGFHGPIYATTPTIDLCSILLPDSGHLQEEDAAFYNKTRASKHHPALPLYTMEEAQQCLTLFRPVNFGEVKQLSEQLVVPLRARGAHSRLVDGGDHRQLGMASREAAVHRRHRPRARQRDRAGQGLCTPVRTEGEDCDLLVMESTYGNREHPHDDPRPEMAALIRTTLQRGGSVVVPSFAVERTQKFLFLLKELMETGQIPRVPVHADSPMAIKAVQIFLKHSEEFTPETKALIEKYGSPLDWSNFYFDVTQDGLEEDQRVEVSDDHRVVEWHGDRRTRAASPDAAPARSQEPGTVHRISGAGNARLHHQERRGHGEDLRPGGSDSRAGGGAGAVQRSRRHAGVAGVAAHIQALRRSRHSWCTASLRRRRSCATP